LTDLSLTLAISTLGDRLDSIPPAPPPGVRRLVLVQCAEKADKHLLTALERHGSEVFCMEGTGVSRSRNQALAFVDDDLLMFGDDDIELSADAIGKFITLFSENPDLDLASGILTDRTGRPHKRYSPPDTPMRRWNVGKLGTPEVVLRPERVRAAGVRFDENFGSGMDRWFGEEFIFLADALRAGLKGVHSDILIGFHPRESSGLITGPQAEAVRKDVFRRALGSLGLPAYHAHALRRRLRDLFTGAAE
jgi:hypothetical protein